MTQSAFSGKDADVYKDNGGYAALDVEVTGWSFDPFMILGEHASTQTDGHMATTKGPQNFNAEITVKLPSVASGLVAPFNIGDDITVRLIADGGTPTADYIQIAARVERHPIAMDRASGDGVETTYALRPRGVRPIYHGLFWSGSGSSGQIS